ncbi:MAG: Sulfate transporter/antisigma-factor antagonist [Rhodocyclaceae bacterium]|nr:Sulfate transporter/antisigma-factor antagonist [Rhodocyclaceae bacterium]
MTIGVLNENRHCRIRLEELTIYTAAEVVEALRAALAGEPASLSIDLVDVSEIDTAGIQMLLMIRQEAQRRQIPVTFIDGGPAIAESLALVNLSPLFQFEMAAAA